MELPFNPSTSIGNALYIEHHVQRIITKQEQHGVLYNQTRAAFYQHVLRERKARLENAIRPYLSLRLERPYNTVVSRPFKADGSYSHIAKQWFPNPEDLCNIAGPFTRVDWTPTNLGSRTQVVSALIQRGWKPAEFTPKGNPKLTVDGEPCPSLLRISDDVGAWIAEWYVLNHRDSQITGFSGRVRSDGCISAEATTIGTPTFRFRHKGVVNVPRSTSLFGRQLRSLFTVPAGRRLVGFDASGLELRMLAHYLNDEDYTHEVINGDIHTKNQHDAGLPDRDSAKTFIYAFNYGAGAAKIGSIVGGSAAVGSSIKRKFLAKNPRLAALIENIESAAGRGYLAGLDGRRLTMRRDPFTKQPQTHKALNTALQGGGAVVMKWAMVLLDLWVRELNLDCHKVIDMHDEAQWDCSKKHADLLGRLGCAAIKDAGVLLRLNIALAGEYKVGLNWAQTH